MKPIYSAPIEERLRDLIRSAQMALTSLEAGHSREISRTDRVQEGLAEDEFAICDWIVRPRFKGERRKYPSGFEWVEMENRWDLIAPSTKIAATVYKNRDMLGHNWFVWDEHGTGGENSSGSTIHYAKIEAESATLRWGRHPVKNVALVK